MTTTGTRQLMVTAAVTANTQEQALRAAEALQRVANGLALDGLEITVSIYPVDGEDE